MTTPKTGRPRGTITRRFTIAGYEVTIRRLAVKRARKAKPEPMYYSELYAANEGKRTKAPAFTAAHHETCICVLCEQRRAERDRILSAGVQYE